MMQSCFKIVKCTPVAKIPAVHVVVMALEITTAVAPIIIKALQEKSEA